MMADKCLQKKEGLLQLFLSCR